MNWRPTSGGTVLIRGGAPTQKSGSGNLGRGERHAADAGAHERDAVRKFRWKTFADHGIFFFDSNRNYTIDKADADGVEEISSRSSTEGPDEDGFGMEECYDWWYLSEDLQEQPCVRYIHDYSRRDKDNNRERIQALHDAVADAVRKRRENK